MVSGHRRNGDVPVAGHPPPGLTRSAMGVTATEALQLTQEKPFWWMITTTGGFSSTLCIMMMMTKHNANVITVLQCTLPVHL